VAWRQASVTFSILQHKNYPSCAPDVAVDISRPHSLQHGDLSYVTGRNHTHQPSQSHRILGFENPLRACFHRSRRRKALRSPRRWSLSSMRSD
jgi:hypothetical protein